MYASFAHRPRERMIGIRRYGTEPYTVAVLHGGPGGGGEMAPVARELAETTGVLEPIQAEASIEGQLGELRSALGDGVSVPSILIGWSWGAWLGFIFAARYPAMVRKLVLVASGPFEAHYAADLMKTRLDRLPEEERVELQSLIDRLGSDDSGDRDGMLARVGDLISRADSFDPVPVEAETMDVRFDIYDTVWREAEELRRSGGLLNLAGDIRCPVTAIHGAYDPHPYQGVKIPLESVLTDFRFILLERCGHTPWIERAARDEFFAILKREIR
jgi:pimeloyl-ACP methyl ester carboxylesterase